MKDEHEKLIARSAEREKTVIYRVGSTGPFGCVAGLIVLCIVVGTLAAFFILGFVTLTVLVWVGAGVALLAVIGAALRRIFGTPPPR